MRMYTNPISIAEVKLYVFVGISRAAFSHYQTVNACCHTFYSNWDKKALQGCRSLQDGEAEVS